MRDLWLTMATGLDGTPMPSYAATSPEELWALSAWVRARAGLPASAPRPLQPDAEEQMGWRIDIEER